MTIDSERIAEAIKRAGGPAAVGRAMQPVVTRQAVSQWVHNGVSAEYAEALEELSGVPAAVLCPRVFGRRPQRVPERAA